ncbi:MAG: hypothetical protein VX741_04885 [Pseudomonadota bacterium]|nr:hypothetical protein [Pseudomonadota bacterium]
MAEQRAQRRLVAILVADIVGYSRLIEADEEGTRTRIRSLHAEVIDPRITADGGRIVKTSGDGILVEFPSAVDAVQTRSPFISGQIVMFRPQFGRIVLATLNLRRPNVRQAFADHRGGQLRAARLAGR